MAKKAKSRSIKNVTSWSWVRKRIHNLLSLSAFICYPTILSVPGLLVSEELLTKECAKLERTPCSVIEAFLELAYSGAALLHSETDLESFMKLSGSLKFAEKLKVTPVNGKTEENSASHLPSKAEEEIKEEILDDFQDVVFNFEETGEDSNFESDFSEKETNKMSKKKRAKRRNIKVENGCEKFKQKIVSETDKSRSEKRKQDDSTLSLQHNNSFLKWESYFKCPICSNSLHSVTSLKTHVKNMHPETPFESIENQIDKKPFVCKHCGKRFSKIQDHADHEIRHDIKEKTVPCNEESCKFMFFTEYQMKHHFNTYHGKYVRKTTVQKFHPQGN